MGQCINAKASFGGKIRFKPKRTQTFTNGDRLGSFWFSTRFTRKKVIRLTRKTVFIGIVSHGTLPGRRLPVGCRYPVYATPVLICSYLKRPAGLTNNLKRGELVYRLNATVNNRSGFPVVQRLHFQSMSYWTRGSFLDGNNEQALKFFTAFPTAFSPLLLVLSPCLGVPGSFFFRQLDLLECSSSQVRSVPQIKEGKCVFVDVKPDQPIVLVTSCQAAKVKKPIHPCRETSF